MQDFGYLSPCPVHFYGVVLGASGLAAQGRDFLDLLDRSGFEPSLESTALVPLEGGVSAEDEELIARCAARPRIAGGVVVHHLPPNTFTPDPDALANVLITAFETTSLPNGWGARMNGADRVVVLSPFNRRSFTAGGVDPERLRWIPVPLRSDHLVPTTEPLGGLPDRGKVFRWLSVFDWGERKGPDILLEAFGRGFRRGEAQLILKITQHPNRSREALEAHCREVVQSVCEEQPPEVFVDDRVLAAEEVPALYAAADGFVLASRGEGWGRTVHEAMLMELPVVATRAGALELLLPDAACGYPVASEQVSVHAKAVAEAPFLAGQCWWQPDREDLTRQMRALIQDTVKAHKRGRHARRHLEILCNRYLVAERMLQLFDELVETAPAGA